MEQITTEEEWEVYCKKNGTYYIPMHVLASEYANMPVALRLYVTMKEEDR